MNIFRPIFILFYAIFALNLSACAKIAIIPLSANLKEKAEIYLRIPKYEIIEIDVTMRLNLLPQDEILNITANIADFGYSRDIEFTYDPNTRNLKCSFVLDEIYTIIDVEEIDLNLKIAYLSGYELQKHTDSNKVTRFNVYQIEWTNRSLKCKIIAPNYKKKYKINNDFNKWNIKKWKYEKLYREIRSLPFEKKYSLSKKLNEAFIGKIKSIALKRYILTTKFLLSN